MQKRVIMKAIRTPGSDFIGRHRASLLTIYIFVSHQASLVCPEYVRGVVTGPLASRSVLPRPPYFLSGELHPLGELGVGSCRRPVGAPRWACGALLCGPECAPLRCAAVGGAPPWGGRAGVSLWGGAARDTGRRGRHLDGLHGVHARISPYPTASVMMVGTRGAGPPARLCMVRSWPRVGSWLRKRSQ